MSKKDHFEELFTSRLKSEVPEMEEWNTPSEQVWENAKVHFPKKKRKRRFFFILFPLIALLAIILVTNSEISEKKTEALLNNIVFPQRNSSNNSTSISEIPNIATNDNSTLSNEMNNTPLQAKKLNKPTNSTNSNSSKESLVIDHSSLNKVTKQEKTTVSTNQKSNLTSSILLENQYKQEPSSINTLLKKNTQISNAIAIPNSNNSNYKSKNNKSIVVENSNQPETNSQKKTANYMAISNLPIALFDTKIKAPILPKPKMIEVKKPISPYRWTAGVSTSRFFQNPFFDEDEMQENEISTKYSIVNLSISLQTGKRSNISTGVTFYDATLNVRDNFIDTYNSNQPSESIASNVAKSSEVGALTINDNESAIMIEFLPDVSLSNGDQLTIQAEIPLKLKAISFPFNYKRQFLMNNFTPYLMGGLSVDIFKIQIDELFLDIRHMNQTIHKPIVFDPISETEIIGSLYLGIGTQYNFNERWYGETGVKVDVFDTKFTTIEAGIHYRF